jgi:hypothetical protein
MASIPEDKRSEIIRALRPEDGERHSPSPSDWINEMIENAGFENLHPALKPWVSSQGETFGPWLKHPFAYCMLGDNGELVHQANQIYKSKISVRRDYLNRRDWWGYLKSLERPWRMHTLEKLWSRKRITHAELEELLIDMWTDTECPQGNQETPMRLFHETGFVTDDAEGWAKLPDEITLYRGVDGELELTADGPSWTLSLKTAQFFAYRGIGKHRTVYRYTATKDEALAYITGRDEAEILLDFDGDSDSDRIEVEECKRKK